MYNTPDTEGNEIQCPFCKAEAVYKYGKIKTGKQRYLCIMCGRQFTHGVRRTEYQPKPLCPECGRLMHLYKREKNIIRFRCSGYPECKTYIKKME